MIMNSNIYIAKTIYDRIESDRIILQLHSFSQSIVMIVYGGEDMSDVDHNVSIFLPFAAERRRDK